MQNCGITNKLRFETILATSRDQRAEPRAQQFFRKPMKLPSKIDRNVLELNRIFEFHSGAGRNIRHQRQGRSRDNEIPERRLFPAANCSGRLQDIHRRRR